jgi:hypothetical protein
MQNFNRKHRPHRSRIEASAAALFYRAATAVKGSRPAKFQLKLGHRFG